MSNPDPRTMNADTQPCLSALPLTALPIAAGIFIFVEGERCMTEHGKGQVGTAVGAQRAFRRLAHRFFFRAYSVRKHPVFFVT